MSITEALWAALAGALGALPIALPLAGIALWNRRRRRRATEEEFRQMLKGAGYCPDGSCGDCGACRLRAAGL